MRRKRGIVAAAVLHVQHERQIEHTRLERRILHIRAQHPQQIGGGRQAVRGVMDVHARAALIVVVGMVGVDREHGEHRNEHEALPQHVRQADVVRVLVIGGERQHAAGQAVHHVARRRLHDNVAREIGRQHAPLREQALEAAELLCVGQSAEQQQICDFLVALASLAHKALHELLNAYAAVVQLARARLQNAVHLALCDDVRDVGQSGQHALAVYVAQAALYIIFPIKSRFDEGIAAAERCKLLHARRDDQNVVFRRHPLAFLPLI